MPRAISKTVLSVKSLLPNSGLKSSDSNKGISKLYSIPILPATNKPVLSCPLSSFFPENEERPAPAPAYQLKFPSKSLTFTMHSQEISKNAIGLRLGGSNAYGGEISYQHALNESNRLEFDLGWRNDNNYGAFKFTGLYQWVWLLDGNFNWYAGAGAGLSSFSGKKELNGQDSTGLFVAGNIGIEYNFDIPLLLSLDFRPEFGNNDFTDNTVFDIALGIRYQF